MFGSVIIPLRVRDELRKPQTPGGIAAPPPDWIAIAVEPAAQDCLVPEPLDDGERASIAVAARRRADLLLMDDRAGVVAARALGLAVSETLGLLDRAARRGFVDLAATFAALRKTKFHCKAELTDRLPEAWRRDAEG
jgi:predicted nucleic acid-binding protein